MCYKYEKKFPKPAVAWKKSPNFSSRNGVIIKKVIYHYTTSNSVDGVISWLCNPAANVSAHYVIARDGAITQLVKDGDRAWHAYQNNADSIGIEVCAEKGQKMTAAQEKALEGLSKFLLSEYPTIETVTAHRFLYPDDGYTDCPGSIFGDNTIDALRVWVSQKLIADFPKLRLPS